MFVDRSPITISRPEPESQLRRVNTGPCRVLKRRNCNSFKLAPKGPNFEYFLRHSNTIIDKSDFIYKFMEQIEHVHYFIFPHLWMTSTNLQMLAFALELEVDEKGDEKKPETTKAYQVFVYGRIPPLSGLSIRKEPSEVPVDDKSSFTYQRAGIKAVKKSQGIADPVSTAVRGIKKAQLPQTLYSDYEKLEECFMISENRTAIKLIAAYPVIYTSLRETDSDDFDSFLSSVRHKLSSVYGPYKYLLKSKKLTEEQKEVFSSYYEKKKYPNLQKRELKEGFRTLSSLLHIHFAKEVVIIIENCDYAITQSRKYKKEDLTCLIKAFIEEMLEITFLNNCSLRKGAFASTSSIDQVTNRNLRSVIACHDLNENCFDRLFGLKMNEVMALGPWNLTMKSSQAKFPDWYNHYGNLCDKLFFPHSVFKFFKVLQKKAQKSPSAVIEMLPLVYEEISPLIQDILKVIDYPPLESKLREIVAKGCTTYERSPNAQHIDYETIKELLCRPGRTNADSSQPISTEGINAFFAILVSEGWLKLFEEKGKQILRVTNNQTHVLFAWALEQLYRKNSTLSEATIRKAADLLDKIFDYENKEDLDKPIGDFCESFKKILNSLPTFIDKLSSIRTWDEIWGNEDLIHILLFSVVLRMQRRGFKGSEVPLLSTRVRPDIVMNDKITGRLLIIEIKYGHTDAQAAFNQIVKQSYADIFPGDDNLPPNQQKLGLGFCVSKNKEIATYHEFLLPSKK